MNDKNERNHYVDVPTKDDIISGFQVSFFAMRSLAFYPWRSLEMRLQGDGSSDILVEILKQTCFHKLCRKTPPSVKYRRLFLTELIKRHEAAGSEPLDDLYCAFADVLGSEDESVCYKSYFLPAGDAISLSESVAAISEGTTGLVTWEAALYLAEWALENTQIFKDRALLELGSGAGLTGVVVCRSCSPARYTFSDCHPCVLRRLQDNVQQNGLGAPGGPRVAVEELDWTAVTDERLQELHADTVIAADVVYDPHIISSLVKLLLRLLRCRVRVPPDIYIASTVRNPDTYDRFKNQLGGAGIRHEVVAGPSSQLFPYSRTSQIELIKLYL
ncbi:protein-lysine N-methyltransferase EEF2KMT [Brienomyrus brachyistius]|uniref:protein-lysine N-methyltransferase EEF2KMT n=1 Tax=Brienomyrus brachyistius TaxID=42636 RepID=UPI0020B33814|nr:protein-lysine N-methyltransferase EEF2KMT [Brienomyrus brachyistius]